jgi:hypothetical protein
MNLKGEMNWRKRTTEGTEFRTVRLLSSYGGRKRILVTSKKEGDDIKQSLQIFQDPHSWHLNNEGRV